MKNLFLSLTLLALVTQAGAQCNLNPTINPSAPILCPGDSDTLWTQQFDSYQWYENGNLVPGATQQFYVVSYFNDAGDQFSVQVTQDTCVEMSPQMLVDGWAFLPPTVINAGAPGIIDSMGVPHFCPGDTVYLILNMPYDISIQWYNNNQPIAGANDDTLIVTSSGAYTVQGAPSLCPNFVQQLGVTILQIFSPVLNPQIQLQANMLVCSVTTASSYQWYLNGNPIAGATSSSYSPSVSGNYVVEITDAYGCSFISNSFSFTVGIEEKENHPVRLYPNPAGNYLFAEWNSNDDLNSYIITDVTGRIVLQSSTGKASGRIEIFTGSLAPGHYYIQFINSSGTVFSLDRFSRAD